ncbi:MAG TPA: 50S ribosomal protein L11 [Phycisphaerales bacterium]|nr:50S ribosomal protein L11 [Phycisphaerales bacterium]
MAKTKEVQTVFKIMAPAGAATPGPPLGPALGGNGVNPGQFIQQFNAATQALKGNVVGCVITVYKDRSFTFEIKSSPASELIKKAAKVEKGSGTPNSNKIGKINRKQVEEIAKAKMADLNAESVDSAMRMIEGTARSMGVVVEG